jgi:PAS domain S-box-containing protein
MASESTTRRDSSTVGVCVIGGGDLAAEAREVLRDAPGVVARAAEVESFLDPPDPSDDCVLVAVPERADAATVGRVSEAVSALPVGALVAAETPALVEAAVSAGAADAFVPDESLAERIAWIAGASPDASASPPAGDSAAGGESSATALDALGALGDAACLLEAGWRVSDFTPAAGGLLDAPPETLRGSNLWAVRPELIGSALRGACWRAVLDGQRGSVELRFGDRGFSVTVVPANDGLLLRFAESAADAAGSETLDHYERIVETIDDGIYTLDENFRITGVNEAVTELTGYSRDELLGAHSTLLADESVIVEASDVIQDILLGERDSGRLEVALETKNGDVFPAETQFSALPSDEGGYGSVGVIRDITDRKRYERTLTGLNRSTDELFRAESKPEVANLVVETATDVLELNSVAVYLLSEEEGALAPVVRSGEDVPSRIGPDEDALWRSFVAESPEAIDAGGDATTYSTPLGEHGLLVTVLEGQRNDDMDTLTELLAANAEAALDRVDRASELAERESALARHNEELERLNRFNKLIREVNRALVEADSRAGIESAVCERLADSPLLEFAWIGEYDAAHDSLAPRAWAGSERGYLDSLLASESADESKFVGSDPTAGSRPGDGRPTADDAPSVRVARDGDPVVVDNVTDGIQGSDWRRRALSCEFLSVASVPLVYNDYGYGVLSVYATDPSAFDDATRTMFEELGETTANAINSAQAKETLLTESVVELDVRVPASNAPLRRMAEAIGGELRLEGHVPQSDGTALLYLSVRDASAPMSSIESVAPVERVTEVTEGDDDARIEVLVDGPTVPAQLADYGAAIDDLVADSEAITAVVEVVRGVDVRELIETLAASYPGTELLARHTHERPIESRQAFRSGLDEELTDRQFDALRTAFLSGYFEWPRERAGQEVAASLDISQPTFARHLRIAQRKLLSHLLDER